jgi:putative flippase GtrA
MNKTIEQFILSAVFGLVNTFVTISVSYILDHEMDERISNIIGLCCGYSVDFFIQKYIFAEQVKNSNSDFATRYAISVFFTIILTQILFMSVREYAKKYKKEWYDKYWQHHKTLLIVRYLTKAVAYTILEFPLNKLWVFKTSSSNK